MNGTFKIKGGTPLRGEVTPLPNKNALMGALPAAALECGGILFNSLPETLDVDIYLKILENLGAVISKTKSGATYIDSHNLHSNLILPSMGKQLRGAFSLAGPLLSRFNRVEIPLPGGCQLGYRSVATHLDAFQKLDISINKKENSVSLTSPKSHSNHYDLWLIEASVSATLNTTLYAVGKGLSVRIKDAACEPHVVEVLNLLTKMGASINGIGTNELFIEPNKSPLKAAEFTADPDYVDIAGTIAATAVTGGNITIHNGNQPAIVGGLCQWFNAFGIDISFYKSKMIVNAPEKIEIASEFLPQAGPDLPKLAVRPWPGFPVDVLPVMVTLACKSTGSILFQNWMYESGFDYVRELNYLGAEILTADPHRIIIREKAINFHGGEIAAPRIIQGTKAIFLAAIADPVETTIHGVDILRRRYPKIFETYKNLGVNIEYE